jgi:hypothetical protein
MHYSNAMSAAFNAVVKVLLTLLLMHVLLSDTQLDATRALTYLASLLIPQILNRSLHHLQQLL